jgi:hypothetical protein
VAVKNGMETPATHFDTGYPGIDTGYPDSTGFLTLATGYTADPGYLTLATPDLIPLENSTSTEYSLGRVCCGGLIIDCNKQSMSAYRSMILSYNLL